MGNTIGDGHSDVVVPGVQVVVSAGQGGASELITDLTTLEALASRIAALPLGGAVRVERTTDPSAFAMACPLARGGIWICYESGAGEGSDTVRVNSADAAKALTDWAVEDSLWEYGFAQEHKMPVPERIPITHEPGYRTDLIGSWDDGQFFAGFCGTTFLHLFDHDGNHVRSDIAVAERELGTGDVTACVEHPPPCGDETEHARLQPAVGRAV